MSRGGAWAYTAPNGAGSEQGSTRGYTEQVGFSLELEKTLLQADWKVGRYAFSPSYGFLIGAGVNVISEVNRGNHRHRLQTSYGIDQIATSKPVNLVSPTIRTGITMQTYSKNRKRLRLGIVYEYMLLPLHKEEFRVTYFQTVHENFDLNAGKHNLMFFLDYPIVLFRNKEQKRYIKAYR